MLSSRMDLEDLMPWDNKIAGSPIYLLSRNKLLNKVFVLDFNIILYISYIHNISPTFLGSVKGCDAMKITRGQRKKWTLKFLRLLWFYKRLPAGKQTSLGLCLLAKVYKSLSRLILIMGVPSVFPGQYLPDLHQIQLWLSLYVEANALSGLEDGSEYVRGCFSSLAVSLKYRHNLND